MMNNKIKKITVIGMFSAIAFILMFLDFSVPIMPSFLKFDISDLPELLGAFIFGPIEGIIVCLIKNLLHLTITSTGGVGELSNFILGTVLCLVSGFIYRMHKTKRNAMLSMLAGSLAMGAVSFVTNLLIVYPFYYNMIPRETILAMYQAILPAVTSIEMSLVVFNVPFTVAKGIVCSIITFFVYKKLKKVLRI